MSFCTNLSLDKLLPCSHYILHQQKGFLLRVTKHLANQSLKKEHILPLQSYASFKRLELALWSKMFVCASVRPFNGLFPPTSQRQMSQLFRFSESLGKSNGKKWSQIWKLFRIKGENLPWPKNVIRNIFHLFIPLKLFLAPTS